MLKSEPKKEPKNEPRREEAEIEGFQHCWRCHCEVRLDQTFCPSCGLRMCDNCE